MELKDIKIGDVFKTIYGNGKVALIDPFNKPWQVFLVFSEYKEEWIGADTRGVCEKGYGD